MNSKESMDHHINDSHYIYIIGGLEHFLFFHILGMSYSQLTFIFFRGVGQPPTRMGVEVANTQAISKWVT